MTNPRKPDHPVNPMFINRWSPRSLTGEESIFTCTLEEALELFKHHAPDVGYGFLAMRYAPDGDLHGTSAALEFAVMGLRVEHIVVMGHAQCGGVRAWVESEADPYLRPLSPGDFIGAWMKLIEPAARGLAQSAAKRYPTAYRGIKKGLTAVGLWHSGGWNKKKDGISVMGSDSSVASTRPTSGAGTEISESVSNGIGHSAGS